MVRNAALPRSSPHDDSRAADLKFLHHCSKLISGTSDRKAGTRFLFGRAFFARAGIRPRVKPEDMLRSKTPWHFVLPANAVTLVTPALRAHGARMASTQSGR